MSEISIEDLTDLIVWIENETSELLGIYQSHKNMIAIFEAVKANDIDEYQKGNVRDLLTHHNEFIDEMQLELDNHFKVKDALQNLLTIRMQQNVH